MSRFDSISQDVLDLGRETANESIAKAFQYLRAVLMKSGKYKGTLQWWVGKDDAAVNVTNAQAVAIVDESALGYVRFEKGLDGKSRLAEEKWCKWLGNKKPPRPNTHTNRDKWELYNNQPSDPWRFKNKVALTFLTGPLTGQTVLFQGDNEVTRTTIADLQTDFIESRQRPIVELGARGTDPNFEIVDHSDDDAPVSGLSLAKDTTVPETVTRSNGNVDDDRVPDDGRFPDDDAPFWAR